MNKIIFFIIGAILLPILNACNQKLDTYSGENVAYIDMSADSTLVSFAYIDADRDTVSVRISLMGEIPNDETRYVSILVNGGNAVAGNDYQALNARYAIEPNHTFVSIPVIVMRPVDETEKTLSIELKENEYFQLNYLQDVPVSGSSLTLSKTKHRIVFHNIMKDPPKTWDKYQFGTFSMNKFQTICTVMEISKANFLSPSYMSYGRARFIASYMKEWLDQNPTDDGGQPMRMGDYLYQ